MQHDPLIEQWLQQQEQQLRQSIQTLVSQVRLSAAEHSNPAIDLKQLQQAQQQDQQQLRQLQQWLLQAQAEKAEALQSLQQLAEQLKLAQQEFRDEKLAHALTQQQLQVVQQQAASVVQAMPDATLSATQADTPEPVAMDLPHTAVEFTEPELMAEPELVAEPAAASDEQQELQQLRLQQQQWLQTQHKLESQLFRAQARADALEERQLSEAEQGRETIRELRQQLSQQQQLVLQQQQQLQDVQLQVTEYRLKFDYAQSQLALLQG